MAFFSYLECTGKSNMFSISAAQRIKQFKTTVQRFATVNGAVFNGSATLSTKRYRELTDPGSNVYSNQICAQFSGCYLYVDMDALPDKDADYQLGLTVPTVSSTILHYCRDGRPLQWSSVLQFADIGIRPRYIVRDTIDWIFYPLIWYTGHRGEPNRGILIVPVVRAE